MKADLHLFGKLLYHCSTEDVFFHWLTPVASTSFRLISRICLLILPICCFDGLINRHVGLFAKLSCDLTATDFKTRWRNHQMSFKHEKRRNDTELSKYLWKLKEKKEGYSISWKIIAKAKAYSNTTKRCNLCITEKFFILSNPQMATLNKRNELISNSRHRRKYILKYSWNFSIFLSYYA